MKSIHSILFLLAFTMLAFLPGTASAQVTCAVPGVPAAGPEACKNPEFQSCRIVVNGVNRHFCLHEPDFPSNDLPVVLGFHGGGGQASVAVNWLDKHTEQGMVLVAPSALQSGADCKTKWRSLGREIATWADMGNANTCLVGGVANGNNHDDLDFMRALMAELNSRYSGEKGANFYALGHSSGGSMVQQLFITEPFASKISGFASNASSIGKHKKQAVSGPMPPLPVLAPYGVNNDKPRPMILSFGTADKGLIPFQTFLDEVPNLVASGACPANAMTDMLEFTQCVRGKSFWPAVGGKHVLVSNFEDTRHWFVKFNNAMPRPIESSYPDVGHGASSRYKDEDDTLVTRRDYQAKAKGRPVSVLTIINGGHVMPGVNGDYPKCSKRNCDVNIVEVILQFWRANAGLVNRWP